MRARKAFIVALGLGLALSWMPLANAIGLIITGTVRDAAGTALAGATVSDGTQTTPPTDATGRYTLNETVPGTYTVTARKSGYVAHPRSVSTATNLNDVDFSLKFLLNPLVPTYVTTKPSNVPLEVTSAGPSSMAVTATVGSTTVNLSYAGISGSLNRWTGSYSLTGTAVEGTSTVAFVGKIGSTVVSDQPSTLFTLDSVVPLIAGLVPGDRGNVAVVSSPIRAVVSDEGSGVDASSISLTLDGAPLLGATFDSSTGVIRSPAVSFLQGSNYRSELTVRDRAGNTSTQSAEFTAIQWTIPAPPEISLSASSPELVSTNPDTQADTWRFPEVGIIAEPFEAQVTGSAHAGWGTIPTFIDLGDAKLRYTLGGQDYSVPASALAGWSSQLILGQQVALMRPASELGNAVVTTSPATANLGDLTVSLPAGAQNPYIDLGTVRRHVYKPGEIDTSRNMADANLICPPLPESSTLCKLDQHVQYLNWTVDYLLTFVSDEEASTLVLQEKAARDGTECVDLASGSPDWVICKANPKVGLVMSLLYTYYYDAAGDLQELWADSTQAAFWFVALGNRPSDVDLTLMAYEASSNPSTILSSHNWIYWACYYAYCWIQDAVAGFGYMSEDENGGDPDETVDSVRRVEEKCSDGASRWAEGNDPYREKCAQAGKIEISDSYRPDNQPRRHRIYAGWYRTVGTADGMLEALGGAWSGPEPRDSAFHWDHEIGYRYVGAIRQKSKDGNCNKPYWDTKEIYPATDWTGSRGGTTAKVVYKNAAYSPSTARGQGQQFYYMMGFNTSESFRCTNSSGTQFSYQGTYRATSVSLMLRGVESQEMNQKGWVYAQLYHIGGKSWSTGLCTLGLIRATVAGSYVGLFLGSLGCVLGEKKWKVDVKTQQHF